MRVLFVGDSITRGTIGSSYVSLLRSRHPDWKIVNRGVNGYPLYNIADHLISILRKDADFDQVVIQAGLNDLLMPYLEKRKGLFRWAMRRERRQDVKPFDDPERFRSFYLVLLKEVRLHTKARVVLINIPMVGESEDAETRSVRNQYNAIIADLAGQANYGFADVSDLAPTSGSTYLYRNFWSYFIWDPLRSRLGLSALLSRKRKLIITVDGVNPNRRGATLFAEAVELAMVRQPSVKTFVSEKIL